jgi:hypothetical protein
VDPDEVAERVRCACWRPFDLATDAPARAELIACDPERILLVLSAHHIVIDGWSKQLPPRRVMVHTHLGEGEDEVRERMRGPLSAYLRSSLGLLLGSQPAGARNLDPSNLRERDVEFLVRRAFDRYYDGAGLLGTVNKARRTVDRLRGLQVDELACLIDFGLPDEQVLGGLDHLNRLRQLVAQGEAGDVAA